MKLRYIYGLAALLAAAFIFAPKIKAQSGDTLMVSWETSPGSGQVQVNALYNAVVGDTNADGSRKDLNRVYLLQKGGVYWNTEHFQNNGYALRFVGQTPDPTDLYGNPPVLQMIARSDGSVDGHILLGYGDVYMKNIYIIGSDNNGVQTYYQPMEFEANNARVVFDNCIFERSNFAITAWNGKNNEIYFTNCKWYNLVERPITQQWTGRAISCWTDEDTIVVENCTMDNVGFTALQVEGGAANYVRFDHNTLINVGRGFTTGGWWREAYFANNLFINNFFDGEGYADFNPIGNPSRDPRAYTSGMFSMAALPAVYGPDLGRRIVFTNSAAYLAQTFKNAWDDTVRIQPYANAVTDSFFNTYSVANGGQMVIKDTMWLSSVPNFTKFDTANYPTMVKFIEDVRAGITPAPEWMQDLQVSGSDTLWTAPQWPIAQNFTYTDQKLLTAGTDGLPLGDLNWFPSQKSQWEANKDKYIQQIQNLAGGQVSLQVDTTLEAEAGTVGGGAAVQNVKGFAYYEFQSAGDIHWSFKLPAAVPNCKLVVYTNLDGSNPRGENIYVNGTNLQNNNGFGEYHFTSPPLVLNGWDSVTIIKDSLVAGNAALDLPAGLNTLEIKKSWGYQAFSGFSIYDASGNLVAKQTIPDADALSGGIAHLDGSPWAPSGYKFVSLGTNGTVSWTVNLPGNGLYLFQAFFQNYSGAQTGKVTMDGNQVANLTFSSNSDSTEQNYLSGQFSASAGMHTFAISGNNVNLDYVQLIAKMVTAVEEHQNVPTGYALEQNYPNPFNPSTNIRFSLAHTTNVKLVIYNILGQRVATLLNNRVMNAGAHVVQFDASRLASGVYFYHLEAGSFKANKKMVLLK